MSTNWLMWTYFGLLADFTIFLFILEARVAVESGLTVVWKCLCMYWICISCFPQFLFPLPHFFQNRTQVFAGHYPGKSVQPLMESQSTGSIQWPGCPFLSSTGLLSEEGLVPLHVSLTSHGLPSLCCISIRSMWCSPLLPMFCSVCLVYVLALHNDWSSRDAI